MPRKVDPDELVGATEAAGRLGVRRETIHLWRRRYSDFPAPVATVERTLVWAWSDVEKWARATGRITIT